MSNSAIFTMDIGAILNDLGGNNMTAEVTYYAGNSAPSGWIPADGRALSRTAYAALFAILGTAFGAGDGATTFNLPDLRGEFLRGWDNGRGVDTGRAMGSGQGDAMQGHGHELASYPGATGYGITTTVNQRAANTGSGTGTGVYTRQALQDFAGLPISDGTNGTPRTAAETRPRNVAMLAIIKY